MSAYGKEQVLRHAFSATRAADDVRLYASPPAPPAGPLRVARSASAAVTRSPIPLPKDVLTRALARWYADFGDGAHRGHARDALATPRREGERQVSAEPDGARSMSQEIGSLARWHADHGDMSRTTPAGDASAQDKTPQHGSEMREEAAEVDGRVPTLRLSREIDALDARITEILARCRESQSEGGRGETHESMVQQRAALTSVSSALGRLSLTLDRLSMETSSGKAVDVATEHASAAATTTDSADPTTARLATEPHARVPGDSDGGFSRAPGAADGRARATLCVHASGAAAAGQDGSGTAVTIEAGVVERLQAVTNLGFKRDAAVASATTGLLFNVTAPSLGDNDHSENDGSDPKRLRAESPLAHARAALRRLAAASETASGTVDPIMALLGKPHSRNKVVVMLFSALCLLNDVPPSMDAARELLSKPSFIDDCLRMSPTDVPETRAALVNHVMKSNRLVVRAHRHRKKTGNTAAAVLANWLGALVVAAGAGGRDAAARA